MTEENRGAANETQLVTFALAGEEFGVPIAVVKEIVRVPEITRVPRAPSFIEGVANLRGAILPIVNLRERFELPAQERTDDNRAVVIELGGKLTGLVVDQVSEVMQIPTDIIEPPPPVLGTSVGVEYLQGVAKLKEGKRLILLLQIDRVIPSIDAAGVTSHGAVQRIETQVRTQNRIEEEQMVSFRMAGEEYAVALSDVQEIIRVPEISRVPGAPSFVEGVVALRNRLLPIVNLRKRFGMPTAEANDDSRIVVINLGGVVTGLQVDAVSEVLSVPRDAIEATPRILSADQAGQLRGVAKLEEGRRLLMLLDAGHVLSTEEIGELATMSSAEQTPEVVDGGGDRRRGLDEEQFVSFRLQEEEFGVSIQQVQEIIWLPEITRVPRAPYFVEGIVNLRGSVLPVVDMRKRFGMPEAKPTDSTSIVVVDVDNRKTGVIVDSVSEVLRISRDAIEPPPAVMGGVDTSFVKGVGKLEGGKRMVIILDLDRTLRLQEETAV